MSSSRGPSRRSPAHGPWRRIPTLPTTPMSSCRPTRTCPANWGTELAHFRSDSPSDGDLEFPSDLWTLKVADSGNNGGKIVISSAHIEASIFHTAIGDAGMTECESESRGLARSFISCAYSHFIPSLDHELQQTTTTTSSSLGPSSVVSWTSPFQSMTTAVPSLGRASKILPLSSQLVLRTRRLRGLMAAAVEEVVEVGAEALHCWASSISRMATSLALSPEAQTIPGPSTPTQRARAR